MQQEAYYKLLNESSVLWVSVCNAEHIPDVARAAGLAPVTDLSALTFYLSEAFGKSVLETAKHHPNLSLLAINMHTFESYQYKGVYQSMRLCTEEEEIQQRAHLDRFITILQGIGISPAERNKISKLYFQQPSYAITFRVQQIFTQTPQIGAGNLVLNLEENS